MIKDLLPSFYLFQMFLLRFLFPIFQCLFLCGINSALDFTDQHLVINGASDLLHELFGKDGDGFHARSAVGFAQLPTGVAVEVEAIFEVLQ